MALVEHALRDQEVVGLNPNVTSLFSPDFLDLSVLQLVITEVQPLFNKKDT